MENCCYLKKPVVKMHRLLMAIYWIASSFLINLITCQNAYNIFQQNQKISKLISNEEYLEAVPASGSYGFLASEFPDFSDYTASDRVRKKNRRLVTIANFQDFDYIANDKLNSEYDSS
ncbi:UNVERIFIED_CONTAM: hypothetical protein RMT77_011254 [Armadillidium vulgare]